MARRIVLAILALVAASIAAVAVPLGVITTEQDRQAFQDEAVASARTLANAAEERLGDHETGPALGRTVADLARAGDLVSVYNSGGRWIAGTTARPALSAPRRIAAAAATEPAVYPSDDRLLVVAPVPVDGGTGSVGVVALSRPTAAVDRQSALLWAVIAVTAAAGLAAAALVAMALARWVARPLRTLENAAQSLGDGQLETRSPADRGPAEIRQLAANFNHMAARLEALVRGHQAAMADVSHQLRTPLAALRLRLDLLAQDSDEAVAAELAGAQDEIARLSRLVNGLLAIARAENVDTPPTRVPVDKVITARVAAWRPAADERAVSLLAEVASVSARMVAGYLEQILDNLIANALDALPEGGQIKITAGAAGRMVRITVADNGPGMTAAQQHAAFRRFASANGGGAGLGLAIVDRLAVGSGGTAALSDTPGGGLTATIELPRLRAGRQPRGRVGREPLQAGPISGAD